ncbi:hypothetical protein BDN72DRAFT_96423 [Pluteus cervinus]|uniref:Uncharacterized protein n=1 Tax=Pluteus cervinus TaxID=181527 RepID=A0ACD2ZY35_9AGAR|nr:hypothetical protein BDN72DRAFT_96423 [Pluteus cervinus]
MARTRSASCPIFTLAVDQFRQTREICLQRSLPVVPPYPSTVYLPYTMLRLSLRPDRILTPEHIINASWQDQDGVTVLVHDASVTGHQGTPFGCLVRGKVLHHERLHNDYGLLVLAPGDNPQHGFSQSENALRRVQDRLPSRRNTLNFIHTTGSTHHMCFTTILSDIDSYKQTAVYDRSGRPILSLTEVDALGWGFNDHDVECLFVLYHVPVPTVEVPNKIMAVAILLEMRLL